jgi:CheY-specific phosphatase CheX
MLSQKTGKKKSVKIDKLILEEKKEFLISLFGVYGDINALMTMVFSKKLLSDTCKIFINDMNSKEELYDALTEYANIVASKINSNFKLYKIEIEATLPRIFQETKQVLEFFDDRKGVLVELDFNGEILKLFLSK